MARAEFLELTAEFERIQAQQHNNYNSTHHLNQGFQKLIHLIQDGSRLKVILPYADELQPDISRCLEAAGRVLTERQGAIVSQRLAAFQGLQQQHSP